MSKEEFDKIRDRFRSFAGPGQSLRELIDKYLEVTDRHFEEMKQAVDAGDAPRVERVAHKAAGPSEMFGISRLAYLLRGLEREAAGGGLTGAKDLTEDIRAELERTRSGLSR